jgi:hypothetical protein
VTPDKYLLHPHYLTSDINRGLNRLGLSLYEQKAPFSRLIDEVPKSEEEQVEDILAQAKEEVSFEGKFGGAHAAAKGNANDNDNDDDDDDDDEDDEDDEDANLDLDDEQLAIKMIRRKVVKAQVGLAELVALLDEAKSAREQEVEEEGLNDDDDDSAEDIDEKGATAYLGLGKKKLVRARKALNKAVNLWAESL